jgi:hypothetical protein
MASPFDLSTMSPTPPDSIGSGATPHSSIVRGANDIPDVNATTVRLAIVHAERRARLAQGVLFSHPRIS